MTHVTPLLSEGERSTSCSTPFLPIPNQVHRPPGTRRDNRASEMTPNKKLY